MIGKNDQDTKQENIFDVGIEAIILAEKLYKIKQDVNLNNYEKKDGKIIIRKQNIE